MSIAMRKNIGAYLHAAYAAAATAVTAGGSGDAAAVTGVAVDRSAVAYPLSASVLYAITATMASTQTLSLAYKVQHSDDSTSGNFADFAAVASAVVLTAKADGSAQVLVVKHDVDLSGAKRWVRIIFTPDLSAANTDTANVSTAWVFGGMAVLP